jgi:hypothetical protein
LTLLDNEDTLRIQNEIEHGFACAEESKTGLYQVRSDDGRVTFTFEADGRLVVETVTLSQYHYYRNVNATPFAIWKSSPILQAVWSREFPRFATAMKLQGAILDKAKNFNK